MRSWSKFSGISPSENPDAVALHVAGRIYFRTGSGNEFAANPASLTEARTRDHYACPRRAGCDVGFAHFGGASADAVDNRQFAEGGKPMPVLAIGCRPTWRPS
jgi:hypothetical protein